MGEGTGERDDLLVMSRYPELFGSDMKNVRMSLMGFGFTVDRGWLPLIHDLLENLSEVVRRENLTDFKIVQVKEKFAELRVYCQGGNEETRRLINEACRKSLQTCEHCGKPSTARSIKGWHTTTCDPCLDEIRREGESRKLKQSARVSEIEKTCLPEDGNE